MGIRYEMAMIPSPIINAHGYWRWFLTFAPADLYDNRLFEIAIAPEINEWSWKERQIQVR